MVKKNSGGGEAPLAVIENPMYAREHVTHGTAVRNPMFAGAEARLTLAPRSDSLSPPPLCL